MSGPLIIPHHGFTPKIDESAFIAPNAVIIGDTEIAADASVWFNCVLRGDVNYIRVGARTNIQDGTVVHVATDSFPTLIGSDVLIGHTALIHACTIEDGAFVGMQACVMDGAVVESKAMVAAGALVTPGKRVPSGELWAGSPAKKLRDLSPEEQAGLKQATDHYVNVARSYQSP